MAPSPALVAKNERPLSLRHRRDELVWQNANGQIAIWQMSGTGSVAHYGSPAVPPTGTHYAGAGDFFANQSTFPDILWVRQSNDALSFSTLDYTGVGPASSDVGSASWEWRIIGTEDFDGDATRDILWRNTVTGAASIWFMSPNNVIRRIATIERALGTDWWFSGTGDFDGNGHPGILWTGPGALKPWRLDLTPNAIGVVETTFTVGVAVDAGPTALPVVVGDYDGDGHADIAWKDANNWVRVWLMASATNVKRITTAGSASDEWTMSTAGDFDADGTSDIVWRNGWTGDVSIWRMVNGSPASYDVPAQGIGYEWTIVGTVKEP